MVYCDQYWTCIVSDVKLYHVVELSVSTTNNSPFQDYPNLDEHKINHHSYNQIIYHNLNKMTEFIKY